MGTIDERIVAMAFENQIFEQRAAQTMATLGKLDAAIKSMDSAKGLENIETSANKVTLKGPMAALDKLRSKLGRSGEGAALGLGEIDKAGNKVSLEGPNRAIDKTQQKLDHLGAGSTFSDIEKASNQVELSGITKAIESVSGKFGLLENAASVALGGIASNAAMKGASFGKSFAFGPVQDGLSEYSTNLNSIQTILANTEGQQVSGLDQVNKHLGELNTYSDQTIYNFSEMAKNIGTFTAAGVDMDKSTQSIKGIANLAALSGSNSQQASTAMYQLSQAISSGKVGLQDWNSVVNAGMGGAVFQKSLMRTAESMGTVEKGAVKIDKATGKATVNGESFRNSIMAKPGQESWLTSDVLVNTLGQLTGDMTDAQLAAQGFTAEQIKAIQQQAKTAKAAATEVKTLPQVFDVARETIGSGWAQTFQYIFGDFNQSKKTFTEMSNFINGWINKVSQARNNMLAEWSKLGGRNELIGGFKQMFTDVVRLLKPIKEAFRDIFPAKTGKDLFNLTKGFHELMVDLRPSPAVMSTVYNAFRIFFDILDIGWSIIKGVVGVIGNLLGVVSKGQGGFVKFIYGISLFVDSVHEALVEGGGLKKFFDGLSSVIQKPIGMISKAAGAIRDLFNPGGTGITFKQRAQEFQEFGRALTPAERLINKLKDAWSNLVDWFGKAKEALEPWFSIFIGKLQSLGQMIRDALAKISVDDILKGVQTGLLATLVLMIKDMFGRGGGVMDQVSKTLGGVQELLEGVTGNLTNMQKKVQAQLILAIAAAVIALAGGVYILSTIDGDKLAKAMAAVAIGLGELMGSLKLMSLGLGKFGALKLPLIAAGIIGIAIAVTILALAMKIMGSLSWEEIAKGLTGIAGSLGVIAGAMRLMPKGPAMVIQAAALLILGVALNAIASAVKVMASMKWEDLGKGLFAFVEILGFIALAMSQMPPNMLASAVAIGILSLSLLTISGAVKAMGSMDLLTIIKGLGGISAALVAIGLAMWLMPPDMILMAAGLVLVGVALGRISKAVETMGSMGVFDLVKGLIALAGVMVILAAGLYLMIGSLPGSLALLAAAAALAVLAPVLGLLGNMKWSTIFKGIAAIALVLGTIAIVGVLAAPALAALGIALIPLGLGFMLVAGAAKIFASAMAMLSDSGQKGIAVFLVAITGFIAILPTIVINFVKGLVSIVDEIYKIAPRVIEALGKIIAMVIAFVIAQAPNLAVAIGTLVDAFVLVLAENAPKLIQAGIQLLMNLLNGISQNIGQITDKVSEIITKFMDALRSNMPKLVDSGVKLLQSFLNGISSKFGALQTTVDTMINRFAQAVASHAVNMVKIAGDMMLKFVGGIASYIPQLVDKAAGIILSLVEGLGRNVNKVVAKGADVIIAFIEGIGKNMNKIANKGADAVISFLNSMADTIRTKGPELKQAGWNVADALIDGIWGGFDDLGHKIVDKLGKLVKLLPAAAKKLLGIKSPSSVFQEIGANTMAGFTKGIDDSKPSVKRGVEDVGKYSMQGMAQGIKDNQSAVSDAALFAGGVMVSKIKDFLGIHSPSEVFRDIGMSVNHGFRDGLLGSRDDVISAFDSLNSSLIDKIRDLRTQVSEGNGRIEDLQQQHADKLAEIAKMRAEKKPDIDAINDAVKESADLEKQIDDETDAVNQNGKALKTARDIRASLTGSMKDEKTQLLVLKKQYDDINKQLEDATTTLGDLTRARDDAQKKYTDQYSAKPDVDSLLSNALADADLTEEERQDKVRKAKEDADKKAKINQVALYEQALQEQLVATAKYQAALQKLRELGLDDETYTKLLDKGLEGQDFADQLLKAGKKGVDQINSLDAQILAKSTELAKQAAKNLYDTGIAVAQGILDGIVSKKADLEKQMQDLADVMVNAIKSKLKIKSPSQIFAEIGQFTVKGLAEGLQDTRKVEGAVINLGRTMTDALASVVSDNMDASPVITPVLDISQLKKDAQGIPDLSNVVPITAATSYTQASATSQEVSASQQAALDAASAAATPTVSFEQNNYSPEALSDVEIYRKTRNQIGQLKSALRVPA